MKRRQFVAAIAASAVSKINLSAASAEGKATLSINATATTITQYDSIRFTPSGWAGFDTAATHAPSGDVYNPCYHDILYFWDTGKTGDFTIPDNLIPAHRSRKYAHGPAIMVCYPDAGTYTLRLYAYEPSSAKFAINTLTINVISADEAYPRTETICINPNGDSDFSAAPSGAQTFELAAGDVFDEKHTAWTTSTGAARRRFLFKGGASFDFSLAFNKADAPDDLMFGSYGTGKATFNGASTTWVPSSWDDASIKKLLINNISIQGTYDPKFLTGSPTRVIGLGGGTHFVMHNVEVDAVGGTAFNLQGSLGFPVYYHFDQFSFTNPGGPEYPILTQAYTHPDSTFGFTGSKILRGVESDFDEGYSGEGGDLRAPIRINHAAWTYFQGSEMFQNTGDQPCVKFCEAGDIPGGVVNVQGCTFESAVGSCFKYKWNRRKGHHGNFLLQRCVLLSGHSEGGTGYAGYIGGQGSSIDGNLHIAPATVGRHPAETRATIRFERSRGAIGESPNKVRNNTSVLYKDGAENLAAKFDTQVNIGGRFSVSDASNLEHKIGFGSTPDAPLEDGPAGVALFTRRNTGRWNMDDDGEFDTTWASDPMEVYSFQPEAGSTALGDAADSFFPLAIDGQTEDDLVSSGRDRGCWQGAA